MQAPEQDLELAKASTPVQQIPDVLHQSDIDGLETFAADRTVVQWQPDWVGHDDDFKPVIFNPLRDPIQVVYLDRGDRRMLTIRPLTKAVVDLAQGAYSFTVMVLGAAGQLKNVAVGNMFSGPLPRSDTDVPVVLDYDGATHKPFVVGRVTDLGEDPSVGGRKVLLDGATPAWGDWTQTSTGVRQFEIRKTQRFPGIDVPTEGPLPGDYQLLAQSERFSVPDFLLIVAAALVAVLSVVATVVRVRRARHRRRRGRQDMRIRAITRPGATTLVTIRDTPAHGEATHAVRLVGRSGIQTVTVREVNDEHCHAG